MKKEEKCIPKALTYGALVSIIIILGVLAQVIFNAKIENEMIANLEYTENAYSDYRVYYTENPFYVEPFIEAGKTYVRDYTNKISTDFSYDVNYTDELNVLEYDYYVRAKLIVFTPGHEDEDLWTREYKLSDVETVNIKNDTNYSLRKTIDIDYQKYREDFDNYRRNAGVQADAKLIVEMIINNHGEYPNLDNFDFSSTIKMEMPLNDATFKIKTSTSVNDDAHKIVKFSEDDHEKVYMNIIAILLWIIALFVAIVLIVVIRNNKNKLTYYEKVLRKILVTYDSIIVNVEKIPSLVGLSVVDVTTFDELVDAQNEVRLPINFKEDKKKRIAKFVLVSNNLAWVYTLKEGVMEDKKN
ncbi:MAG: DUF5305 family protein [Bacilli bacterium]|nr:DUF5305 family protein [Bacilli bacterium]